MASADESGSLDDTNGVNAIDAGVNQDDVDGMAEHKTGFDGSMALRGTVLGPSMLIVSSIRVICVLFKALAWLFQLGSCFCRNNVRRIVDFVDNVEDGQKILGRSGNMLRLSILGSWPSGSTLGWKVFQIVALIPGSILLAIVEILLNILLLYCVLWTFCLTLQAPVIQFFIVCAGTGEETPKQERDPQEVARDHAQKEERRRQERARAEIARKLERGEPLSGYEGS